MWYCTLSNHWRALSAFNPDKTRQKKELKEVMSLIHPTKITTVLFPCLPLFSSEIEINLFYLYREAKIMIILYSITPRPQYLRVPSSPSWDLISPGQGTVPTPNHSTFWGRTLNLCRLCNFFSAWAQHLSQWVWVLFWVLDSALCPSPELHVQGCRGNGNVLQSPIKVSKSALNGLRREIKGEKQASLEIERPLLNFWFSYLLYDLQHDSPLIFLL